jgi:hypothetical protein
MDSLISRTVDAPTQLGNRAPTHEEIAIYNTSVRPKLFKLALMIGEGKPEPEIFDYLGIAKEEFYAYKQLFPEMAQAINQGKTFFVDKAEKALFIAATGQTVTESEVDTTYVVDEFGNETPVKRHKIVKQKYIPPNTKALELLLTNKDPKNWTRAINNSAMGTTNILQINATQDDVDNIMKRLGDPLSSLELPEED